MWNYFMTDIIIIGRCCRISFDFIRSNLKKQATSLFEWTWTDTLTEINYVLNRLLFDLPIHIIRIDNDDVFEGTNIKTSHYIDRNYQEIVDRRAMRLKNTLRNSNQILFVRDDLLNTIQLDEIQEFFSIIHCFNPKLECKLLLLSNDKNFTPIKFPGLYHYPYDQSRYESYIESCT